MFQSSNEEQLSSHEPFSPLASSGRSRGFDWLGWSCRVHLDPWVWVGSRIGAYYLLSFQPACLRKEHVGDLMSPLPQHPVFSLSQSLLGLDDYKTTSLIPYTTSSIPLLPIWSLQLFAARPTDHSLAPPSLNASDSTKSHLPNNSPSPHPSFCGSGAGQVSRGYGQRLCKTERPGLVNLGSESFHWFDRCTSYRPSEEARQKW